MPKIPKYDQQVGLDTPNVPIPSYPSDNGVLNSMNNVAEANRGIAQQVGNIGGMIGDIAKQKRQEYNNSLVADNYNSYLKEMDDKSYSNDIEEVTVNGVKQQRPKGILNRKLGSAAGSSQEIDQYYNTKVRNKYLDNIKDPSSKMKFGIMMDKHYYSTYRDAAFRNEAKQVREDYINRAGSAIKSQIDASSVANTPDSLNVALENVSKLSNDYSNIVGLDPDTSTLNRNKNISEALKTSISSALYSDKSGASARGLLGSVKDKVDSNTYQETEKYISNQVEKNSADLKDNLNQRLIDGELGIDDVLAASKPKEEGGIGGVAAKKLVNDLKSVQEKKETDIYNNVNDAKKYIKLLDKTLLDDVDDYKFREIVVDAYADGSANQQEIQNLQKMRSLLNQIHER